MQFDFSTVEEETIFAVLPEGVHLCRVGEVRAGTSRDGSARWSLRLDAVEGEHAGRTAAWDSITWSERGVHRVRHVLAGLGFDVGGVVEIEPEDLIGRVARVSLVLEERDDPVRGGRVVRLRVPYLGYEAADGVDVDAWGGQGGSSGDDPFGGSERSRSAG